LSRQKKRQAPFFGVVAWRIWVKAERMGITYREARCKPRLYFVVDDIFIKQNAVQNAEVISQMPEMIDFNRFYLCFQLVKAFFKRAIQGYLFKAVFYEIQAVPEKPYGKNYPCYQQKQNRRNRGKNFHYFIQNIPSGHRATILHQQWLCQSADAQAKKCRRHFLA
jgi:hypothetical protein